MNIMIIDIENVTWYDWAKLIRSKDSRAWQFIFVGCSGYKDIRDTCDILPNCRFLTTKQGKNSADMFISFLVGGLKERNIDNNVVVMTGDCFATILKENLELLNIDLLVPYISSSLSKEERIKLVDSYFRWIGLSKMKTESMQLHNAV